MRFKTYLLEKITKKEFDDALNNPNIMAGCEFEFYFEGEGNRPPVQIEQLERMADRVDRSLDRYRNDLDEY